MEKFEISIQNFTNDNIVTGVIEFSFIRNCIENFMLKCFQRIDLT